MLFHLGEHFGQFLTRATLYFNNAMQKGHSQATDPPQSHPPGSGNGRNGVPWLGDTAQGGGKEAGLAPELGQASQAFLVALVPVQPVLRMARAVKYKMATNSNNDDDPTLPT